MDSLDIDFLFTNILQEETIDICIDGLYNDNENTPKMFFCNLFKVATK